MTTPDSDLTQARTINSVTFGHGLNTDTITWTQPIAGTYIQPYETPSFPIRYNNGNYDVEIDRDGTKTRIPHEPGADPITYSYSPILPESIDLSITNRCTHNCPFCYMGAHAGGNHCSNDIVYAILGSLGEGREVAFGGGNPLMHPSFVHYLDYARGRKILSNVTINYKDVLMGKLEVLADLQEQYLLYGIGVSAPYLTRSADGDFSIGRVELQFSPEYAYRHNIVIHCIAGIHRYAQIQMYLENRYNVLLLGYKSGVRITNYDSALANELFLRMPRLMELARRDNTGNLYVDTLGMDSMLGWMPRDALGYRAAVDGEFTMYIDATTRRYSVSSSSLDAYPMPENGIEGLEDVFRNVRTLARQLNT